MKQWRQQFPVEVMSRVFNVSRSGFYAWEGRKPSRHAQEDERLKVAIKALCDNIGETLIPPVYTVGRGGLNHGS